MQFLLTPLREGRRYLRYPAARWNYFYSRPCGRGDPDGLDNALIRRGISTHAPAGGATGSGQPKGILADFYSRPCGRGDGVCADVNSLVTRFLLTPLREGRPDGLLGRRG